MEKNKHPFTENEFNIRQIKAKKIRFCNWKMDEIRVIKRKQLNRKRAEEGRGRSGKGRTFDRSKTNQRRNLRREKDTSEFSKKTGYEIVESFNGGGDANIERKIYKIID